MRGVSFQIADLGSNYLGMSAGNTIWLDDNAAGWGRFVDATPNSDSEFLRRGNQGEQNRMDLLTVAMHEIGHFLGHDHDEGGLMTETLAAGVRRTVSPHDHAALTDQVFGQAIYQRTNAWLGIWPTEQLDSDRLRGRRRTSCVSFPAVVR